MNEAWRAALARAIRDVFENLCFMMAAPKSTVPPEPVGGARVVVVVDFCGDGRGSLLLSLPDSLVTPIASAMLGVDGPLELAEQYDAVCELANIVCGHVLPLVAGERAVFDLSSPRLNATMAPSLGEGDASVDVLLDDGLVSASLTLQLEEHQGAA